MVSKNNIHVKLAGSSRTTLKQKRRDPETALQDNSGKCAFGAPGTKNTDIYERILSHVTKRTRRMVGTQQGGVAVLTFLT